MSDKDDLKLLAAASVNAFAGPPAGIEFKTNIGFVVATRASAGSYDLELKHPHNSNELVVTATLNNASGGSIAASLPQKGHIQVNTVDSGGAPTDSAFWIRVDRAD